MFHYSLSLGAETFTFQKNSMDMIYVPTQYIFWKAFNLIKALSRVVC